MSMTKNLLEVLEDEKNQQEQDTALLDRPTGAKMVKPESDGNGSRKLELVETP